MTPYPPTSVPQPPIRPSSLLAAALLAVAATGCQRLSYTGPHGERFTRSSFASATSIGQLSVDVSTNGIQRVEMRGYQNDSTQAIGAVTEAAVRAAVQSTLP